MTPKQDTRPGRPQTERQAAFLARLRDKGLGLAPVMADGRVVRSRPSNKAPASGGAERGGSVPQGPGGVITHPDDSDRSTGHTAGQMFDVIVPAPCEFLNANRDKSLHWAEKGRRVSAWRREGMRAADFADLPTGVPRVRIDAYVRKPIANRFDPANWAPTAKAVVDGLVTDYGLCEDDNRHFVEGPFMHDGGKGEPALRVVVTVLEVMAA